MAIAASRDRLPRLVATDLDGTVLRSDGSMDPRTRRALRDMERAGVVVVFVTGRPPRWMHQIAEATGHTGLAICGNGALLYDMHTESVVDAHLLDVATLQEVTRRLREAFPGIAFAVEFGKEFAHEPAYVHEYDIGLREIRIAYCPEILDQPAVKLLARVDSIDPDTLLAEATALVGRQVSITHSSLIGLLEISALGVTKASALAELAERQRVPARDVLAFGDMPNDLAMLTWAGRSVAVANAHPAVRAAADEVTASNDESGVALVLERLLRES